MCLTNGVKKLPWPLTTHNELFDTLYYITIRIQKLWRPWPALYYIINRNSPLSIANRLNNYKIYLKSILLYTTTTWGLLNSDTTWEKINAVQYIALRTLSDTHYVDWNKIHSSIRLHSNIRRTKEHKNTTTTTMTHKQVPTLKAFVF